MHLEKEAYKGLNETFSPIYHAKSQQFDFGAKQVRKCKYEIFVRF